MLSNEISRRKNLLGLGHLGLFGAVLASDGAEESHNVCMRLIEQGIDDGHDQSSSRFPSTSRRRSAP